MLITSMISLVLIVKPLSLIFYWVRLLLTLLMLRSLFLWDYRSEGVFIFIKKKRCCADFKTEKI